MAKKVNANSIPKTVKVGYSQFSLIPRDEIWAKKQKAVGECHAYKSIIEYDKTQNSNELVNTLIHETLHAIAYVFDIEFRNSREEEDVVRKMANGLQTVMGDNPEFIMWALKSMEKKLNDE